jgi:hypothetical protein
MPVGEARLQSELGDGAGPQIVHHPRHVAQERPQQVFAQGWPHDLLHVAEGQVRIVFDAGLPSLGAARSP